MRMALIGVTEMVTVARCISGGERPAPWPAIEWHVKVTGRKLLAGDLRAAQNWGLYWTSLKDGQAWHHWPLWTLPKKLEQHPSQQVNDIGSGWKKLLRPCCDSNYSVKRGRPGNSRSLFPVCNTCVDNWLICLWLNPQRASLFRDRPTWSLRDPWTMGSHTQITRMRWVVSSGCCSLLQWFFFWEIKGKTTIFRVPFFQIWSTQRGDPSASHIPEAAVYPIRKLRWSRKSARTPSCWPQSNQNLSGRVVRDSSVWPPF